MKKIFSLIFCVVLCLGIVSCGAEKDAEKNSEVDTPETDTSPMNEAEIKQLYTTPENFIGRTLELSGKVFTAPEYDTDGVYFQMFADPEMSGMNTVVFYPDPNFELEIDDYVILSGSVKSVFEGENAFGGKVTAPTIVADTLIISTYAEVMAPTIATALPAVPTVDQLGYSVTVQKVELAETETRVYVSITNNGTDTFDMYSFNAKLIQNGKQYEEETNYEADYPEIQNDLSIGVTTEGIITFPPIEEAPFQIVLPANSGNYHEEINDYTYDLTIQ